MVRLFNVYYPTRVLVLFGAYQGTVRTDGFHWTNPFNKKIKVSLRARNLNGDKLKVNDKSGNPIEIAAVVVWRVTDTGRVRVAFKGRTVADLPAHALVDDAPRYRRPSARPLRHRQVFARRHQLRRLRCGSSPSR